MYLFSVHLKAHDDTKVSFEASSVQSSDKFPGPSQFHGQKCKIALSYKWIH